MTPEQSTHHANNSRLIDAALRDKLGELYPSLTFRVMVDYDFVIDRHRIVVQLHMAGTDTLPVDPPQEEIDAMVERMAVNLGRLIALPPANEKQELWAVQSLVPGEREKEFMALAHHRDGGVNKIDEVTETDGRKTR